MESLVDIANETAQPVCQFVYLTVCQHVIIIIIIYCQTACPFFSGPARLAAAAAPSRLARHRSMGV